MALLSEQGIINNVYDAAAQALRTTTNIVLSGVELSLNSAVEIKDASTDTRVKVKTDGTDNGIVVIQNTQPLPTGASTAANQQIIIDKLTQQILSGTTLTLDAPVEIKDATSDTRAKVKSDGTDNGLVVILNTIPTISGNVTANQGARGSDAWPISGIVVVGGPSTFTSLTSGITSTQGLAAATNLVLMGFSCIETAGSVAQFILNHGTSNSGPIISWVSLSANESSREWYGPQGKAVPNGVYVQRVSGTTQVTLDSKIGV